MELGRWIEKIEFCTQRSINFLLCAVHCLTVCWGRTVVVETFPYATFWRKTVSSDKFMRFEN